jgi:hypothetical protein
MPEAGLTESWNAAEAALPVGWELMGVVRGPRDADPQIRSEAWVAWMRSPEGIRVEGEGDSPEQALSALAENMGQSGMAFRVE